MQGVVTPDEWTVFKPTLATGHRAIVGRRLGTKEVRLVYADGSKGTRSEPTPAGERARFCLTDDDVLTLARWACLIEEHYSDLAGHPQPMDIEWAKDGIDGRPGHRPGAAGDGAFRESRARRPPRCIRLTATPGRRS